MLLKNLVVEGYRGFAVPQTIRLARPDGRVGSGLTVLVGANNSGKSSILEAIHFLREPGKSFELVEGQKSARTNGRVRITYATEAGQLVLQTGAGGTANWEANGRNVNGGEVVVIPSRRVIDSSFQLSDQPRVLWARSLPDFATRRVGGSSFAARLTAIEKDSQSFDAIWRRLFPVPARWYLERTEQGLHYMRVTNSGSPHNSDGLGQGVTASIHVADALYDAQAGQVIAIDEPELSLHPAAQRRLATICAEQASDKQIILATHSPYFAPMEYLAVGATIVRTYLKDGIPTVAQLTQSTAESLTGLMRDRQNPHVLGLDAREVLFLEDNVILVEGQDDVLGYRRIGESLGLRSNASFFGWGVGGAPKMKIIAMLLRDLGVTRVYGLLDSGHGAERDELRASFPSYRFETIPAPDIRTKKAQKAREEVLGILNDEWNVRPEYEDALRKILEGVGEYFS